VSGRMHGDQHGQNREKNRRPGALPKHCR
jgi:hypothetical protein